MVNYGDLQGKHKDFYDDQINERRIELNSSLNQALQQVNKLLFLANGGGAAAMLAFIGTTTDVIPNRGLALASFCVGLVFYAFYVAWSYHFTHHVTFSFIGDVNIFRVNQISHEELYQRENVRNAKDFWGKFLAYASLVGFLTGMFWGGKPYIIKFFVDIGSLIMKFFGNADSLIVKLLGSLSLMFFDFVNYFWNFISYIF